MKGSVPGAQRLSVKKTVTKNKGKSKKVTRMTITKAKGGYLAEHHGDGENGWQEPAKHVLSDMKALHAHMSQHMGDEPEAEDNAAEEAKEA